MKKKSPTSDKNIRNAHMLLAAYWAIKVLSGGNVLKTTLKVAKTEGRSVLNEKREQKIQSGGARKEVQKSHGKAAAKGLAGAALGAALRKVVKSQRVY